MAKTSGTARSGSSPTKSKPTKESLNSSYKKEVSSITSKYVKELNKLTAQEVTANVKFETMVKGNSASFMHGRIVSTPQQDAWLKNAISEINEKRERLEKRKKIQIDTTFKKYKKLAVKYKIS